MLCRLQKMSAARYDKVPLVRQAAMAALTEIAAIPEPPPSNTETNTEQQGQQEREGPPTPPLRQRQQQRRQQQEGQQQQQRQQWQGLEKGRAPKQRLQLTRKPWVDATAAPPCDQ